ncbi:hypothetical protein Z957_07425 [Clostridium sp. K25]|uniref:DUF3888 domain-containing protein n=1 Tax=Clostridium botulinum D str. 1873 TaxID=592027 RepID=A0A9P2G954_CLOBO|nr:MULTISPECIES: DUF3888 domain-containing protein [Clostridium]AYF54060.1 DUF3888 domain-containing protein [Clostridium novyi]EES92239.1 conserved hypothetical protein [Clostridium botulinum D str. 1873]KEI08347.1 hypothetical protein Z957_07425 [Clostridium sp. K25]MBO3442670.1 DUF3888 domain-containing protein [Clostridium haemolyticum]MCD3216804.1 DUF3888 domain-containing protein [Clostridium botulinum C]
MKKILIGFISSLMIFCSIVSVSIAKEKNVDKREYNDFLITLLGSNIINTLDDYYGKPRSFEMKNAEVLEVRKIEEGMYFIVTIRVRNFDKRTNNDYGIDTMTLANTSEGAQLLDFQHIKEPDSTSI